MGTYNDDITLILAKAKLNGFLPDVKDEEVAILRDAATNIFLGEDSVFNGAFGPTYGQKWVVDGDSITIGGTTANTTGQDRSASWAACMAYKSMGRINLVRNAGLGGQRIDGGLSRFAAEVAAYTPDVVLATFGTNDIGQNRTLAQFMNDLEIYYRRVSALNARMIVGTIWPRSDTNAMRDKTALWNESIRKWAKVKGVQVIDWHARFGDSNGGWPPGISSDGIHPTSGTKSNDIGQFAWDSVKNRVPLNPHFARAEAQGTDALTNGFMQTVTTLAAPNLTAGVANVGSGELPAGTYSYKYTTRTYWGESVPSAERVVTLSAKGGITITNSTVGTARGYRIYRKGPGETTWRFIGTSSLGTNTSFVDDGSAIPGAEITNIDTSQVITGLTVGSAANKQMPADNKLVYTEEGILGNIFRLMPIENFTTTPNDYFPINVTAGEVWELSCLVRSTGDASALFAARFRDGANANLSQNYTIRDRINGFSLVYNKVTVPANATIMRVSMEQDSGVTNGYVEYAELQAKKLS
ncbi:esterase/lipase [Arthrobacter phage Jasmine]|uniref:Hydrolase n=1 Tax=Arthrobacter phage Jasmine TaxID=1772302 RepID=A0A0U4IL94_9CAUD|nr:esterase/lipase [Arthrobacter phage Jasmine]ALY09290.1 hydrolase [Arthrobacter phage Jasmine]